MKTLIAVISFVALSCKSDSQGIDQKKQLLKEAADRRVTNISSILKADCDSVLMREAFRRVSERHKKKPSR